MLHKKIEPIDLTTLTDDEIHYKGECFLKEFEELLDEYQPYFWNHYFYVKLYYILNFIKPQLKREERRVV